MDDHAIRVETPWFVFEVSAAVVHAVALHLLMVEVLHALLVFGPQLLSAVGVAMTGH